MAWSWLLAVLLSAVRLAAAEPELPLLTSLPEDVEAADPLLGLGYLDVTKAPYHADPTGAHDATAAINRAVVDARDHQLITFFPAGTYLISDTILCMKPGQRRGAVSARDISCVLVGSRRGARPVLKLAPRAAGFDNPQQPKPLVLMWAVPQKKDSQRRGSTDPNHEQPNINFNQVFQGIDLDLGGNPGAIGIRHSGSQGSTLEDVRIAATGGFAGVYNCPGQGGGMYNVEINGGRYGAYIANTRFPLIVGSVFRGQTACGIYQKIDLPLVVVGCQFHLTQGVAIHLDAPKGHGASVVDSIIDFHEAGNTAIVNAHDRNLFLRNVWLHNAATVVRGADPLTATAAGWTRVERLAICDRDSTHLLNGQQSSQAVRALAAAAAPPDGAALRRQHLWDEAIPHFEAADVFNVKQAGAKGDGRTDDTAALQRAIDAHETVFLPKGLYRVSRTLTLRPRTRLFGVGKHHSIILAADQWGKPATPIVATENNAAAATSLAFVGIYYPASSGYFTALHWQAGHASTVRDVYVSIVDRQPSHAPHIGAFHISGAGGGRWYAVCSDENKLWGVSGHEDYRVLLIEGTREPLSLYGVNVERSRSSPQMEIRDAQHVQVYYLKTESGTHYMEGPGKGADNRSTSLRIRNSRDVSIFGCTGVVLLNPDMALVEVQDSEEVLLTQVRPFKGENGWYSLRERAGATITRVDSTQGVSLFWRSSTQRNAGRPE